MLGDSVRGIHPKVGQGAPWPTVAKAQEMSAGDFSSP